MQQTSSGLVLPDYADFKTMRQAREDEGLEPELPALTEDDAKRFIANNKAIQRDMKKAQKAYARLQATIKHEVQALADRGGRVEA